LDPAVICMSEYLNRNYFNEKDEPYIAVNLREFPSEYSKEDIGKRVNGQLQRFTQQLCDKYSENNIRLIPMHYFHVGGDDRIFLNSIKLDLECQNLSVQNKPLTLFETMHVFKNAMLNVGMRFHSVVFQTMLNGNNIILDYTEPDKGKIGGFISDVDGNSFYQNRYINLQNMEALDISITDDINENKSFEVDLNKLKEKTAIYHSLDNYLS
ncbi:MAG: polysaccharide pyruvyl transferase family protein, partial [Bacteroidia bacterium]|nr:polysaccharide pyruvyl transferase family protein [Bacteroidia bacterium]